MGRVGAGWGVRGLGGAWGGAGWGVWGLGGAGGGWVGCVGAGWGVWGLRQWVREPDLYSIVGGGGWSSCMLAS